MSVNPLWTAMVTPFNEDGSIDFESFEFIIRQQEAAGNGVLVLGSTGEGLNLTGEEKKEIIDFAIGLDLDVPLMAGIGGFAINDQLDFIKYCDEKGVDAFLVVQPLYAKPGKEGQLQWFETLVGATSTPCMLYNIPGRVGSKMHPSVPKEILKLENFMGLKEASGSVNEFREFKEFSPALDLYSGDDILLKEFTKEGAVGLVSVVSNTWPEQTRKMVQLCLDGEYESLFSFWTESVAAFFSAPNPIPVKALLQHKGWIKSDAVRMPLSRKDLTSEMEEALLEADKRLNDWFNS